MRAGTIGPVERGGEECQNGWGRWGRVGIGGRVGLGVLTFGSWRKRTALRTRSCLEPDASMVWAAVDVDGECDGGDGGWRCSGWRHNGRREQSPPFSAAVSGPSAHRLSGRPTVANLLPPSTQRPSPFPDIHRFQTLTTACASTSIIQAYPTLCPFFLFTPSKQETKRKRTASPVVVVVAFIRIIQWRRRYLCVCVCVCRFKPTQPPTHT